MCTIRINKQNKNTGKGNEINTKLESRNSRRRRLIGPSLNLLVI